MQLVSSGITSSVTLTSAQEIDMLPGGTTGFNPEGADTIVVSLKETGGSNAITTVKVYVSSGYVQGSVVGALLPLSTTTSVSAGGTRQITIKGYAGGNIRVTGNSTSGSTGYADVCGYFSGNSQGTFQLLLDGVAQNQALGGTITGNFSQASGTASIEATGSAVLDATTSVTIGGTNATSVAVGASGVAPSFPGGLTIAAGKAVTGGSGALTVDTTGALDIGPTLATSVVMGASGVAPSFPGGLTVAAGKAITGGSGTLTLDTTGALDLGTTLATSVVAGAAGIPLDCKGGVQAPSGDAGAAGTTGTVSKRCGTFTLTGTTFVLTNTTVATTDLCFVTCQTAAPGAYIASVVPTSNTLTVTFSTSVTSMKCAFFLVASGG